MFSIHTNFRARKSLIGTCPGSEPVKPLSHDRWLKFCNVQLKTTPYTIQKNTVIGNIMEFSSGYRALLIFRRVNGQSGILMTEFEGLLLADSSTKAKLLQALFTLQTPVLTTFLN